MEFQLANGFIALVDEPDITLISGFLWKAYEYGGRGLIYASTRVGGSQIYMHRLITGAEDSEYVDHIDRNGINNQRSNLRIVSQGVNIANAKMFANNTSGYKGVIRFGQGWRAQIKHRQKLIHSRTLYDIVEAALLRDELTLRLFGKGCYLNLPDAPHPPEIIAEAQRLISLRLYD